MGSDMDPNGAAMRNYHSLNFRKSEEDPAMTIRNFLEMRESSWSNVVQKLDVEVSFLEYL